MYCNKLHAWRSTQATLLSSLTARQLKDHGVYISHLIRFARASSHVLTSTLAINCYLRNFLNKAIGIINFAKPFPNVMDDTMI